MEFGGRLTPEGEACVACLHGVVKGNAFQAACEYEYARGSPILVEAADLHRRDHEASQISRRLNSKFRCGDLPIQIPWSAFWTCPSFAGKPWNLLPENEWKYIVRLYPREGGDVGPSRLPDVADLDAAGTFDRFKALARSVSSRRKRRVTSPHSCRSVDPILSDGSMLTFFLSIDTAKSRKRLLDEYAAWLDTPVIRNRLKRNRQIPAGKSVLAKDRVLKDQLSHRRK